MKKTRTPVSLLLCTLLAMLMLLMLLPLGTVSFAAGETPGDTVVTVVETGDCGAEGSEVRYALYSDGKLIIEGTGEIVDWWSSNKPVKEGIGVIKDCAFQQRMDIREVIIGEDITHVGDYAFDGCTALETVRLPESKTTFGVSVFSNCSSLHDFSIPDYLYLIPDYMFDGCSSLDITIPKRIQRIGVRAFANTALQKLNISPLYIAEGAFANCNSLKYAILPRLSVINSQVFAGCTSLEWVEVSPGLETAIKSEAFGNPGTFGCEALTDVYVMASEEKWNNVTIEEKNDCLLNATLHFHEDEKHENLVESIEEPTCTKPGSAVFTCTLCGRQITDEVPALEHDYVWTIEQNSTETEPGFASAVCANDPTHTLSFEIPARCAAEKVGECGANGDAVFYVLYNDNTLVVLGTGEIREDAFSLYNNSVLSRTTDIIIEDGITAIGTGAFHSYSFYGGGTSETAPSVVLADSVKTIHRGAFAGCAFSSFDFGSVEKIERNAFYLTSIARVVLPDTLTYLGAQNFQACMMTDTTVVFGDNLKYIDDWTFQHSSIQKAIFRNPNTKIHSYMGEAFMPCDANNPVTFYSYAGGSVEAYANQYNNASFVDLATYHEYDDGVITTPATCTEDGVKTFTCILCGNTYTEPVSALGSHDWGDWTIVQNSTDTEPGLAQRVCRIDSSHTESFAIPAYGPAVKVGYCGKDGDPVYFAIYEDNTMHVFGEGVVCENVFLLVTPYQPSDLVIDEGITELARLSFRYMGYDEGYLTSVTFPDSLTKIGQASFWDCTNITEIRFGKGLTYVDMDAFPYLTHLETIALPDSVTHLGNQAFYGCVRLKTAVIPAGVTAIGSKTFCECRRLENLVILNGNAAMADNCLVEIDGANPTIYSYSGGSVEAFANKNGFRFVPLDEDGHAYDDGVITAPATCGTDGVKIFTCAVCGDSYTETISATGAHSYQGVVTTAATCETDGVKTFTCAVCGDSYTEPVAATGHNWSEWIVTRNPSETREGEAYRYCKNDPTHIEHKTIDKLPETNEEGGNIFQQILDWVRSFFDRIGEAFRNLFRF